MLPSFLSVALRAATMRNASKFSSCVIGRSKSMAICPGRAACPSSFPIKAFSTAAEIQDEGELYPDIDVGSLFCINHGRCFLLDGKLCSSFQHTGRARAVLQDLGFALGSGSTFFVVRNTPMVKEKTLLASMARLMDELRISAAGSLPKTEIGGQELFVLEAQDQVPAWPSSGIGEDFRENAESCQKLMIEMGERIVASMSTVLELPEESMKIQGSKMTMNAYEGASACREWRTDPSLLRIMWSSSEGGHILEVQSESGKSVPVDCGQARLIILAGQRLESITEGAIKAAKYRMSGKGDSQQPSYTIEASVG